jgi:hypothetical protein
MSTPYFYDENVDQFVEWLNSGLKNYSAKPE